MDRELTERERQVLSALVRATGSEALVDQLADLQVTGMCECGCPTISFARAREPGGIEVVADADVLDESGALLLFVSSSGRLASLEYAWVTDSPPSEFPDTEILAVKRA